MGVRSLLRAEDAGLLLGFAQKEDAFGCRELGPILRRNVVFALPFLEENDRDEVAINEGIDLIEILGRHRAHERRRSDRLLAVVAKEGRRHLVHLQPRLIDVEVHAVDAFDFQGHVITQDIGNRTRYAHGWLRSTSVSRDHHRFERSNWERFGASRDRPELFYSTHASSV
jgi:hypothetical protein